DVIARGVGVVDHPHLAEGILVAGADVQGDQGARRVVPAGAPLVVVHAAQHERVVVAEPPDVDPLDLQGLGRDLADHGKRVVERALLLPHVPGELDEGVVVPARPYALLTPLSSLPCGHAFSPLDPPGASGGSVSPLYSPPRPPANRPRQGRLLHFPATSTSCCSAAVQGARQRRNRKPKKPDMTSTAELSSPSSASALLTNGVTDPDYTLEHRYT